MNLFTKLKESLKRQGRFVLASGLACLIIGLSAGKSHAAGNATERFNQGIWPDGFKKLKDKNREEQVKEDALKLKKELENEELEREREQTEAQRRKPSLDNNQVLPSPFRDIELNLRRNNAIDLLLRNSPKPQVIPEQGDETTSADMGKSAQTHDHVRDDDDDDDHKKNELENENDIHGDKQRNKREEKLLKKPVFISPNDWVPDKFDPLNNGGFATSPDNGSPVPYRLNGHVDLERGRPWLHD